METIITILPTNKDMPKLEQAEPMNVNKSHNKRKYEEMILQNCDIKWEKWIKLNEQVLLTINDEYILGKILRINPKFVIIKSIEQETSKLYNHNYKINVENQHMLEQIFDFNDVTLNETKDVFKNQLFNTNHANCSALTKENCTKKRKQSDKLHEKKKKQQEDSLELFVDFRERQKSAKKVLNEKMIKKNKQKCCKWTAKETQAVIQGVAKYQHHFHAKRGMEGVWAHIKNDKVLGLILKKRTGRQIKDKWRHLQCQWKK